MKFRLKRLFKYSSLGLFAVLSSHAYAAGYKMEFQSASVLADSGEAAVVEDAGTNWYNSAGLTSLPQQLVFTGFDVYAPVTFSGTEFAPSPFPAPIGSSYFASGSSSSYPNVVIPSFHYSLPLRPNWAFGLSLAPAWGFTEDYGNGSMVRYNLIRIETRTFDIAPSLAWQINNQWSIGAGPDLHYFSVLSRSGVRTEGLPPFGTPGDSYSRFDGNSWNWGGHIGVLFRPNDSTRVGLNYRSQITQNIDGSSQFFLNSGPEFANNDFALRVPLPAVTTLSLYHDIDTTWAFMATAAYDQWSRLQSYHAFNYQGAGFIYPSVYLPQHMRDTVDLGIGVHYTVNDQVMLRGSLKYLPTPTSDNYRQLSFPDGRKIGLNVGGRYQWTPKLAFDAMYGRVWVKTQSINDVNPITFATASGKTHAHLDIFGAQMVWTI